MELNDLLQTAVECGASRLLLTAGAPPSFRIHGVFQQAELEPLTRHACETICVPLMNASQREELRRNRTVELTLAVPTLGRFHVSLQQHGPKISASIRPLKSFAPMLEAIEFAPGFLSLIQARSGLIVVGGSADSGRSTTVAAIIERINQIETCHIVTLEDRLETLFRNERSVIMQREIGTDCHSMTEGLQQARQLDPDIIVTTELTEQSELDAILRFAISGRLAIVMMTGPTAMFCVEQMIGHYPPSRRRVARNMIGNCLQGVVMQKLIPASTADSRVLAQEVLLANDIVRQHISHSRIGELENVMRDVRFPQMQTMDQAVERLRSNGLIDLPEQGNQSTAWLAQLPYLLPPESD